MKTKTRTDQAQVIAHSTHSAHRGAKAQRRPEHPEHHERVENVFASAVIKLDFFLSALLGVVPCVEEGFLLPGLRTVIPR